MSIPWFRLVRLALAGTLLVTMAVIVDVQDKGGNPVGLIQPGADGPSVEVFRQDFPDLRIPGGIGHDGQQFYAIARAPMHLDETSEHLDRPQYRLQRPLYPVLSWTLHPTGGGYGLVRAMALVGVLAIFLAGVGAGALSRQLGGGTWPALVVPLLPGTYAAMRLSLSADTLALGLVLISLTAAERGRAAPAAIGAVLAAFAKESILVVVVGHALVRRTRASVIAAISSTVTTGLWWLALRFLVDTDTDQVIEFTWPFGGIVDNFDKWFGGSDWYSGIIVVGSFALAALALWRRGPSHPLFGALVAVTSFSVFLGPDVFGPGFNGPRTIGPVLVLAGLTLATRSPYGDHDQSSEVAPAGSVEGPQR